MAWVEGEVLWKNGRQRGSRSRGRKPRRRRGLRWVLGRVLGWDFGGCVGVFGLDCGIDWGDGMGIKIWRCFGGFVCAQDCKNRSRLGTVCA